VKAEDPNAVVYYKGNPQFKSEKAKVIHKHTIQTLTECRGEADGEIQETGRNSKEPGHTG